MNTTSLSSLILKTRFAQLRAFLVVAELGSFHKAAKHLAMTQPALTRSMKELESNFSVTLFERSNQGVKLTILGQEFVRHAQNILNQLSATSEHLAEIQSGLYGNVTIATLPVVFAEVLPLLVTRLDALESRIQLRFVRATLKQSITMLQQGEVDLIAGRISEKVEPGLVNMPLLYDDICVVAGPENPLCDLDQLSLADLMAESWILPGSKDSLLLRDVERTFQRNGLSMPARLMEVASVQTTRKLLRTSNRIAFFSYATAIEEISHGLIKPLNVEMETVLSPVGITTRSEEQQSPATQLVQRVLVEICHELIDEGKFISRSV